MPSPCVNLHNYFTTFLHHRPNESDALWRVDTLGGILIGGLLQQNDRAIGSSAFDAEVQSPALSDLNHATPVHEEVAVPAVPENDLCPLFRFGALHVHAHGCAATPDTTVA